MADDRIRRLQRHVHAACRELGLDAETRRALQEQATGKASMSGMSAAELGAVMNALKARGWKPQGQGGGRKEARADLRLIWVYWGKLARAGKMRPGRQALNEFISSTKFAYKYGRAKTDISFIDEERAQDVIEALKDIARRNQVSLAR